MWGRLRDRTRRRPLRAGRPPGPAPVLILDQSVLKFVREAVHDPAVQAINKATCIGPGPQPVHPTPDPSGRVGKQVACLVELQVRPTNRGTSEWRGGCSLSRPIEGLKTHTKTDAGDPVEGHDARCYAHIGTGNYHRQTSRISTRTLVS